MTDDHSLLLKWLLPLSSLDILLYPSVSLLYFLASSSVFFIHTHLLRSTVLGFFSTLRFVSHSLVLPEGISDRTLVQLLWMSRWLGISIFIQDLASNSSPICPTAHWVLLDTLKSTLNSTCPALNLESCHFPKHDVLSVFLISMNDDLIRPFAQARNPWVFLDADFSFTVYIQHITNISLYLIIQNISQNVPVLALSTSLTLVQATMHSCLTYHDCFSCGLSTSILCQPILSS